MTAAAKKRTAKRNAIRKPRKGRGLVSTRSFELGVWDTLQNYVTETQGTTQAALKEAICMFLKSKGRACPACELVEAPA